MPANSRKTDPSSQPTFVFKGTVQELKSTTMKEVPVSARTIVVSVDQVLEAPKNLAKLGGHKVTVQLSGKQKARVGQEMIFYTQGWIAGIRVVRGATFNFNGVLGLQCTGDDVRIALDPKNSDIVYVAYNDDKGTAGMRCTFCARRIAARRGHRN